MVCACECICGDMAISVCENVCKCLHVYDYVYRRIKS